VWRSRREKNFFELCQRHTGDDDDDVVVDDDDDDIILLVVFQ